MRNVKKTKPLIEVLEPRLLFSADAFGGALSTADSLDSDLPTEALDQLQPQLLALTGSQEDTNAGYRTVSDESDDEQRLTPLTNKDQLDDKARVEVVFVDTTVSDYQQLLDDLVSQSSSERRFDIVLVDYEDDGVSVITDTLAQYRDLDAVHVISHGDKGELRLGSDTLNSETIGVDSGELSAWGDALAEGGDILFYGCDIAATESGQSLLNDIARLTGADVAASVDVTGHADRGGDWELEFQTGHVESSVIISDETQQAWTGSLATITVDTTDDVVDGDTSSVAALLADNGADGAISLREAIIAANNTAGADVIELGAGNYELTLGSTSENLAAQGDLDILSDITINGTGATDTFISSPSTGDRLFEVFGGSSLTLNDLSLTEVSATNTPGGGIYSSGTLTVNNVVFSHLDVINSDGGALYIHNGSANISDSAFIYNSATNGGAISVNGGSTTIVNSTISNNVSVNNGAGIEALAGTLTLEHVTIADNTISTAGSGAGIFSGGATINMSYSIVANNTAPSPEDDIKGAVVSGGYNIVEDNAGVTGLVASDTTGSDGGIGVLASNDDTYVHTIDSTGDAYNAATGSTSVADQRGISRDANPDIGAYEYIAATGNEAPSYNYGAGDGSVTTDIESGSTDAAYNVAVQSDGKLVVAGYSFIGGSLNFSLTRYNGDGSLDTSFGTDGIVYTDLSGGTDYAADVIVQADGKIILVGESGGDFGIARYNSDGSLDTSFGGGDGIVTTAIGTATDSAYGAAVQADGKIVVTGVADNSGNLDLALVRYNTDGSLDTSFGGGDGIVTTAVGSGHDHGTGIVIQDDGQILVSGNSWGGSNYDFSLVRYNTDGTLDTSFGSGGITTTAIGPGDDIGVRLVLQDDGRIVVGGYSYNGSNQDFAVIRYNTDGSLDSTFGSGTGIVTTAIGTGDDVAYSIDLQDDGKILLGGYSHNGSDNDFAVVRYNADGSLDTSFGGGDGIQTTNIAGGNETGYRVLVQDNGQIVIVGQSGADFGVVRYSADGSLDTQFDASTTLDGNPTFVENGSAVVLDSDVDVSDSDLDALNGGLGNYSGASLTLERDGGADADDLFDFNDGNGITLVGTDLIKNGQIIASFDTSTSGMLVVTFTDANGETPTSADADAILRQIAYSNSNDTPPTSVQIGWIFSDGNAGLQGTGGARTATGATIVNITSVNDEPAGSDNTIVITEDTPYTLTSADFGYSDSDGDAFDRVWITTLPTEGQLLFNGSTFPAGNWIAQSDIDLGLLTYEPAADGTGVGYDAFTFEVQDDGGTANGGQDRDQTANTITFNVTNVNDASVAADDSATVDEASSVIINVAGNDADVDDGLDLSSITITSGPTNGSLVDNGDGTLTYTHDGSETVGDTFSYTIDDASGATSNVANVTLTVNPVNDAPVAIDDSATVDEASSVIINVAGNDTDADNALDLSSIVITSGPTNGSLVDNGDGTLTYTHDGSETVGDSFSYTIDDASGAASNVANVTLTVNPISDAPIAIDDSATVDEASSVIINVAGNDADVDDGLDLNSITITSGPSNGSLVDNGDGTLTYTHDGSETGSDSFSYTIDDASGATSNVANVTLTVNPVNDAPVAVDDSASVDEASSVIINVAGNDTDADNALDLSSIVITSGPSNGSLVDNGDGTLTYTHDGSETVGDSFSYTIDDASGATSNVANVTLTVNPVNDAPVASDDSATVDEVSSVIIDVVGNDTDADDALDLSSIVITSGPTNGSLVDNGDGTLTYTHDGSETVGDSFSYTIDDASGATSNVANVTLTVNPVNDAPVAADNSATVDEASSVIINVASNDSDADNALDLSSIVITSGPSNGSLVDNGDGTLTYTHDGSETVGDTFSYTIDDASGATSNVANVTLTVNPINDAPVASDDSATVDEASSVIINVASNDTDADNALDLSSIVITTGPSNGSLVDNGDGTLTYIHDGSESLGDSFSYTINDASGATSNIANVTLTVNPVNDAPVAADDGAIVDEASSVIINVVSNDTDAENALDLSSIVITSGPSSGSLVDNGDGTLTYTHDGSETVGDSFSYTIDDAAGATSNVANVTLTVNPVNDAPVASDDSATVDEASSVIINVVSNDTDADNALDLSSIVFTSGPSNGSLVDNGDGTLTYTHDGSETVGDTFSYTIDDASGATSNVANVTLTVNPVNDTPIASDDSATVDEASSVIISIASNDTDADNALDFSSIVITSGPTNGSLVDNGDGTLTYTHDSSETVGDSFSYTIDDASGATSNVANVTLTVNPVNDAPVATDDSATVDEASSVIINVASNDTDADNALDLSSIVITSGPTNGSLVDNGDGTLTYTHDGSETVGDTFSYTIDDATGATSNIANVTLTVVPVNDAPVAIDDSATVDEASSVIINVASNDTDADNALDLSSIVITSGPTNGSLVDNGDGTLTYTHDGSETVGDSFSYTIDDASGATSNVANVTLTVNPVNDAPVAVDDSATVGEGNTVIINVVGNDSDADDGLDLSSITIISAPGNGSLVDNGDGTLTYTHDGSETVGDNFSYTIDDAAGITSNVANVTLTVTPINDAPVAADDSAAVDEGNSVIINIASNDTDDDSALDFSSIIITSGPANGSLVDNGDGTLTYTHDGSETVSDNFTYTIDDASGATSNVASVTLTVNPVNDAPVATDDSATVTEGSFVIIDIASNDIDADDGLDLSTITITSGPANGSLVDNGDGTLTYTHDGSETSADSFSYTISDVSGTSSNTATVSLNVTPVNNAPVAVDDSATVDEGSSVTINIAGNDTDSDDALDLSSIVITSGPSNGTLVDNGDGTLTYTHDGSETVSDSFSYTVNDTTGATSNVANVAMTVSPLNNSPVALDNSATVDEGNSVTIDVAGNDADPDNALDLSSIVITSGPSNGTLVDNGDGTLTYLHDGSETIGDTFSYTIDDLSGATSNIATVTMTINPVNDTPVAANDSATVDEGNSVVIDIAANDSDAENSLDLNSIVIISGPSNGTLTNNGDGTLTYTHDGSESVSDSFSYTINDASGATSNVANVALSVNPVNDAPIATDDSATVDEASSVIINVTSNDTDADDALDLSSIVITSGPSNGSLVDNGDGTLTYTHDGSESVSDSFSYTIDDASGTTSNVGNVALTVNPVNDAPVAVDESAIVAEGNSVVIGITANDTDVDNALDLSSIVIVSGPANGTLSDNGDGTLTYIHDGSETAADSFSYTIDDVSGTTSNVANVSLSVVASNDAPVAVDDSAIVDEGSSVIISVTSNDGDADDGLDFGSIVITSGPANGSLVDNGDGTLTYNHDGAESVSDSFSYTISDASGATSNTASVALSVLPVNDPPVVADNTTSVEAGGSVTIDLVSNASDVDSALDLGSINIVSAPLNGTLIDNGDGTLTYLQIGTSAASDQFTYTISDSEGASSNLGTVNIIIEPASIPDQGEASGGQEEPAKEMEPELPTIVTQPVVSPDSPADTLAHEEETEQTESHADPDAKTGVSDVLDNEPLAAFHGSELIAVAGEIAPLPSNTTFEPTDTKKKLPEKFVDLIDLDLAIFDPDDQVPASSLMLMERQDFKSEMDQMREDLDKASEQQKAEQRISTEVTIGLTVSLTAGFVGWVLKSGSLMASLLTALPMWRHFDPLPLVVTKDREENIRDNEEDQVEELFNAK